MSCDTPAAGSITVNKSLRKDEYYGNLPLLYSSVRFWFWYIVNIHPPVTPAIQWLLTAGCFPLCQYLDSYFHLNVFISFRLQPL